MTGQSETKHTPGTMVRDGHNMSSVIICTVPRGHPDAKHVCGDYETIARCEGDNWSPNAARIALTWNCHDELVAALRQARAEIVAADVLGARNEAGFVTDMALWAGRAVATIDAALAKASA